MKLSLTRAIIDAIHDGSLSEAPTEKDPIFGFDVISACPGVPDNVLIPRNTWESKEAYDSTANKLAELFIKNFEKYAAESSAEIRAAGPRASQKQG